jgi:hypothetical protein
MRLSLSESIVLVLVALAVLAASRLFFEPAAAHPSAADDLWRRTAHGWERVDAWQVPSATWREAARPASTYRFDTHPAAIALVQIVAAAIALAFFPSRPGTASDSMQAAIARSYRASFFGS